MRAIILAAGVGSRLRPVTDAVPKTLVEVGGKPILAYQIDALLAVGVRDIVICTGYLSDRILEACRSRYPELPIRFVENPVYETTNNMYSLYLAREHLEGEILILNGDVCFEATTIEGLLDVDGSAVAVDTSVFNEESMKVVVDGHVRDIAKTIREDDAFGCSIDVYKLASPDVATLARALRDIIEGDQTLNLWTEVLLQRLFKDGRVRAKPFVISGQWLEVDDHADLNRAEQTFNPKFRTLANRRVFFFDRDGTLSLGDTIIDGAAELLALLREREVPYYVLTNNSSRTAEEHHGRLNSLPITVDQIVVSTDAAIAHLQRVGVTRILLSATASVTQYFRDRGFITDDGEPQAVVLTYNRDITYAGITELVEALRSGLPYYATHIDLLYPYEGGFLPDIGAFINLLETTTGRRPERHFGKPSTMMIEHLLKKHGLGAEDAVIVGDRMYTDIALAMDSEMASVLVLSGETQREHLSSYPFRPDVILDSVADLLPLFR